MALLAKEKLQIFYIAISRLKKYISTHLYVKENFEFDLSKVIFNNIFAIVCYRSSTGDLLLLENDLNKIVSINYIYKFCLGDYNVGFKN